MAKFIAKTIIVVAAVLGCCWAYCQMGLNMVKKVTKMYVEND